MDIEEAGTAAATGMRAPLGLGLAAGAVAQWCFADRLLARGWAELTEDTVFANVEYLRARLAVRPVGVDPI